MAVPHQFLTFRLSGRVCALALVYVERVLRAVELLPLPQAPAIVSGVVNLWGEVIPVFDLRNCFGLAVNPLSAHDHLIIVQTAQRRLALLAEDVEDVVTARPEHLIAARQLAPGLTLVSGVLKLGDELALIHDLEQLLAAEEVIALDEALRQVAPALTPLP